MQPQKYSKPANHAIATGNDAIVAFEVFCHKLSTKYSSVFILCDTNTHSLCLPWLRNQFVLSDSLHIIVIPPGERSKSLSTATKIYYRMSELGADRHSLLICLGGGVVCDLGGFIAATYQRGIEFIMIPTTLLAQVDAAIGGKTGVDLGVLKNYVGLFVPSRGVFIFDALLKTLPFDQILSGYAEVLKHALIGGKEYFDHLLHSVPDLASLRSLTCWSEIVERSVGIKQKIVLADPFEMGARKALNFGHTFGHAFESLSLSIHQEPIAHGNAVAMGMVAEMYLSGCMAEMPQAVINLTSQYILHLFPHFRISVNHTDELLRLMTNDKKNRNKEVRMTLLKDIGIPTTDVVVPLAMLRLALEYYRSATVR